MEQRWKKAAGIGIAAVLTLALLAGVGTLAFPGVRAQTPPGSTAPAAGGPAVIMAQGKITELKSSGFTLQTRKDTINVTVSAQTWIVLGGDKSTNTGPTEGSFSALKTDMMVEVAGTSPATGQIAARVVREGHIGDRPENKHPGKPGAGMTGTISAIDGTILTLTLNDSTTLQVQTDATTLVLKGGFAAVSDLKVGDKATINPLLGEFGGQRGGKLGGKGNGDNGTFDAPPGGFFNGPPMDMPNIAPVDPANPGNPAALPPGGPLPNPVANIIWVAGANEELVPGIVQSVDGTTLTVQGMKKATYAVQLAPSTAYRLITGPGQVATSANASDVQAKTLVLIVGTKVDGKDSTLTANAVVLHPRPAAPVKP